MRIKKISQNEVTVYLSEQELGGYDIKPGEKIPESAALHRFLFELMDTVYIETGFNPYGGQVVVEATPMQNGMSLTISKICKTRRMTREEFKNVKKIHVKAKDADITDLKELSHEDILNIVEDLAHKKLKQRNIKAGKGIFIFRDFKSIENAFAVIPQEAFVGCKLYRNKTKYAVLTNYTVGSKYYNIFSEFAEQIISSDIVIADIKESWKKIADGNSLVQMVDAIRDMI